MDTKDRALRKIRSYQLHRSSVQAMVVVRNTLNQHGLRRSTYADTLGAEYIHDRLGSFAEEEQTHWPISPVLDQAIKAKSTIRDVLK